jgi:3-isopropylmalate/(R)-2-methylmalate dehydratase small subunit
MSPFEPLDAVGLPIEAANVDTDQILPARFLRKPRGGGFAGFLFHDLRFAEDGAEHAGFVLNRPPYRAARILVAERNFGCGSSREAAVWALSDYGFRAVIAPSFGDIFYMNCFKQGLLPIVLPAEAAAGLRRQLCDHPGARIAIDLAAQRVTAPDGTTCDFEIPGFRKKCLAEGLDEIAYTLSLAERIADFEARHEDWLKSA